MGWLPKGYAACDTCGIARAVVSDREASIQLLRAGGWRHMAGRTLGGQDFETILCAGCTKDEHRRSRTKPSEQEDTLPIDWEAHRVVRGKEGIQHR